MSASIVRRTDRYLAILLLLALVAAALSAGCQGSGDPSEENFIQGVFSIMSDRYQQETSDAEGQLTNAQNEQADLRARAQDIQRQNEEVATQLDEARRQVDVLKRSIESLHARLRQKPTAAEHSAPQDASGEQAADKTAPDPALLQQAEDHVNEALRRVQKVEESSRDPRQPPEQTRAEVESLKTFIDSTSSMVNRLFPPVERRPWAPTPTPPPTS